MGRIFAVAKREFASYFTTPVGYIVIGVYALVTGIAFAYTYLWYARVTQAPTDFNYTAIPPLEETMLSPFLVFCGQMIVFLTPLITMRLLAEERHRGTMELLLTHPLRDRDIIFGKYIAALGMAVLLMLVAAVYLALVAWTADVEPAVLALGLLAVFLMAAAFLSLGLFVSAMTRNQITAATLTLGAFLLLFILGAAGRDLPEQNPAPAVWGETLRSVAGFLYGIFGAIVRELPLDAHAQAMAEGIVTPVDVVYYVLFAAFFIFLTFRALESRKWRAAE
jgi:ABC-2 type transport system permease protein